MRLLKPLVILAGVLLAASPAAAQLRPNQVALVYNTNSEISRQLAINYARARNVPDAHRIGLDLPMTEEIERDEYYARCVEPLRKQLTDLGIADQVRCLVTFYDVPLRVRPEPAADEALALARKLDRAYADAAQQLKDRCLDFDLLARPDNGAFDPTPGRPAGDDLAKLKLYYETVRNAAVDRASRIKDDKSPERQRQLIELVRETTGVIPLLRSAEVTGDGASDFAHRRQMALRRQADLALEQIAFLLANPPLSPEREQARQLVLSAFGLVGALGRIDHDRRQLRGTETVAALDSELTLLWYDAYPAYIWLPNPDNPRTSLAEARGVVEPPVPTKRGTLMVSRLDGANPRIVQRLMDDAIAVERTGLRGRVYIDTDPDKNGAGYQECNENLLALAELIRSRTTLQVTLDTKPALFGPGDCPQTALYCGWYSHRHYIDAFEWLPGAVGMHVASSEAVSLRDPDVQYWCKRMLDEGVTATIGPVHEPYLAAFPFPTDFFGLLLTGKYSLAECYHLTTPLLSWQMILIGDPLYRPFAADPQLAVADVFPPDVLANLPPPLNSPGVASPPRRAENAQPARAPAAGQR